MLHAVMPSIPFVGWVEDMLILVKLKPSSRDVHLGIPNPEGFGS